MTTSTLTLTQQDLSFQDIQDRRAGADELERRAAERASYGDAREAGELRARAAAVREDIRREAVYRVHRRHAGCILPDADALADEYERETLHVASLARQYPWSEVVSTPTAPFLTRMRERDTTFDAALGDGPR